MSRCFDRLLFVAVLCALGMGLLAPVGRAQESEAKKAVDVDKLIKQLDAEDFGTRQDASQRLIAAGEAAIPAVEKAVQSDSREVSTRAFDILKTHFDKGSLAVKESARQALDRLGKGDLGSISRQASEIITPAKPATPNAVPAGAFAPGGLRIAVGRVMVVGAAAGGGVESKIKIEDGVKTTEVKDKDRQVKIVDDPAKGIQLEVTETKDGKETTQKYAAKDADELKTKHAEAHKIYEQYTQKGAEIKIGGFGPAAVPIAPGVLPARFFPAIPAPPAPPIPVVIPVPAPVPVFADIAPPSEVKKQTTSLEALDKALQDADASLKELSKGEGDKEQLAKARTRLEEARKQLEILRAALK